MVISKAATFSTAIPCKEKPASPRGDKTKVEAAKAIAEADARTAGIINNERITFIILFLSYCMLALKLAPSVERGTPFTSVASNPDMLKSVVAGVCPMLISQFTVTNSPIANPFASAT